MNLTTINHEINVLTAKTMKVGWYVKSTIGPSPTVRQMMYADTPSSTRSTMTLVTLAGIAISFLGRVWVSFSAMFSTLMHFN